MVRITVSTGQFAGLVELIRGFVRFLRRLVLVAAGAAVLLAVLLQRDGFTGTEVGLTIVCLVPPAFLLFFAQSIQAVLSVPDRLRRMPGDGQERLAELTRVAGEARTAAPAACRCSSGDCGVPSRRCAMSRVSPCRCGPSRPDSWRSLRCRPPYASCCRRSCWSPCWSWPSAARPGSGPPRTTRRARGSVRTHA